MILVDNGLANPEDLQAASGGPSMRINLFALFMITFLFSASTNAEPITMIELDPPDIEIVNDATLRKNPAGRLILNRHDFWVSYFKKETGGKLTFLPFLRGKTKKQSLLIQKDYVHYQEAAGQRVGILIRLEANVETQDSDVVINKFHDIGAAAQLGIARGTIRVKVYGLDGPPVYQLRFEVDLSSVSLAELEKQISALHSKILTDQALIVAPVVLPSLIFTHRDLARK
jgi:hypothetical protein